MIALNMLTLENTTGQKKPRIQYAVPRRWFRNFKRMLVAIEPKSVSVRPANPSCYWQRRLLPAL